MAVMTTACSDSDFLEETPKDSISPANFYKSADDAEAAVNGAYTALQDNAYYSRYWVTSSAHAAEARLRPARDRTPAPAPRPARARRGPRRGRAVS